MAGFNNSAAYHAASKPRPASEVNEAIRQFLSDVQAARQKHGIMDVMVAVQVAVKYDEGSGIAFTWSHIGNSMLSELMAAQVLGEASAERRRVVNQAVAGQSKESGQ